jgi:hypothetical protein
MHSGVLKNFKYHDRMRTKAEILMEMNMYITLVQNSKCKFPEE